VTAPAGGSRRDLGAPIESIGAPPAVVDGRAGLEAMRLLLRQGATMVVRIGVVLLLLAALLRLLPAPSPADAVADDMAIVISAAVVIAGGGYLFWTRHLVARLRPPSEEDGGELVARGRGR
jgi:hypothetical protein